MMIKRCSWAAFGLDFTSLHVAKLAYFHQWLLPRVHNICMGRALTNQSKVTAASNTPGFSS